MEWYHIYLFTRIDYVITVLEVLLILIMITSVVLVCFSPLFYDEKNLLPKAYKAAKILIIIAICTIGLRVIIPNQREVAAIYLVPKIVGNESVQKIPENMAKLLELKLNQWIEESIKEN